MNTRSLGSNICQALAQHGCRTVFGIPGIHNQELYRSLAECGLDHVLARHEQGAGFMADGYARATGRPGVALVITGPGLANAATPIGQAYSDSVPMLVLATCHDDSTTWRARLHEAKDQTQFGAAIADWCETAQTAQEAYGLIDRAFAEFTTMRPRPKIIQLPLKLLTAGAAAPAPPPAVAPRPSPGPAVIRRTAHLLSEARRPLFIFGTGASAAASAAREIVDRSGAAVLEAIPGRGIIPGSHPMNFGAFIRRPESPSIIGSADLVIVVGTALSEADIRTGDPGHRAPMIKVDHDSDAHIALKDGDTAILCDPAQFLEALRETMVDGGKADWRAEEVAAGRAMLIASCDAGRPGCLAAAQAIASVMDHDTLIYSDMTQLAYVACETVGTECPGQWHHPLGFGTLGYALPAAIGGKIGAPERPVIAVAGDYGLQYTSQELAVAAERDLALPVVIWDNGTLQEIEDGMARDGIASHAAQATRPNFQKLADAYGVGYRSVRKVEDLAAQIRDHLTVRRPTLIHVQLS